MAEETIAQIPLDRLAESSMNTRRIRDKLVDRQLAESIKARGVLVPLIVRKNGKGYEILAGSRRFRASKEAKLKTVPVRVIEATDGVAREIIVIENLQRADIHPLDEADGFCDLLEKSGGDYDGVANKVNKTRAYVVQRSRLANLSPTWRKAWMDQPQHFGVEHARQLSRLDQARQQELGRQFQQVPYVDELREAIDDAYLLDLKTAKWDLKDEKLHPKAGSCANCPKRSGSDKDLFSDLKGEICTDRACFLEKSAALARSKLKEDKKLLALSDHWNHKEKVKGAIARDRWHGIRNGKECEYSATGIVVEPRSQDFCKVGAVCLKKDKCKVHKHDGQYESPRERSAQPKVSKKERKKRIEKNQKVRRQIEENDEVLTQVVHSRWRFNLEDAKDICEEFWNRMWNEKQISMAIRRGWVKSRKEMQYPHHFEIRKAWLDKVKDVNELWKLMVEALYAHDVGDKGHPKMSRELAAFSRRHKVNMKAVKVAVDGAEKQRERDRVERRKKAAAERVEARKKASGAKKAGASKK